MKGKRRRNRMTLNAEINVVSLIDVMMLLLVIFMLTAPMMTGGVDLTLPSAEAVPLDSKSGLVVMVDRQGVIHLNDTPMSLDVFRATFKSVASRRATKGVDFQADSGASWGVLAPVIAIMKAAGVDELGLALNPIEKPPQ